MLFPKYIVKAVAHKHVLIFAGGVATVLVGKKILESDAVKNAATEAMAGVMSIKQNAEDTFTEMRTEAEEIAAGDEKTKIDIEE